MDEGITAKWAKTETKLTNQRKVENQLIECETAISNAVEKGVFNTTVYFFSKEETTKELESRGFIVEQTDHQIGGTHITISW